MSKKLSEMTDQEVEAATSDEIEAAMALDAEAGDETGDTTVPETPVEDEAAEEPDGGEPADSDDAPDEAGDTDSETPDDDPYQEMLRELGLAERYKRPGDALKALREQDKTITQLQMEKAQMEKDRTRLLDLLPRIDSPKTAVPKEEEYDPVKMVDRFTEDPRGSLKEMGVATRSDLQKLEERFAELDRREAVNEIASFLDGHEPLKTAATTMRRSGRLPEPGTAPEWDKLIAAQKAANLSSPYIDDIAVWKVLIPQVFPPAVDTGNGVAPKPLVKPVATTVKERAKTAGTGGKKPQPVDFNKMTTEEIESYYRDQGRITT